MKSEKGITLITLVITLIVMLILVSTMAINFAPFKNEVKRNSFEEDMNALREGVEQYYAKNKKLPVINKYTYTLSFQNSKNVNDNENYYIIDIRELDVDLHLGDDFYQALAREKSEEINDLLDIYIINEGSHTIYYPKGVEYNERINYTIIESYNNVKEGLQDTTSPTVNITFAKSENLFGIVATIELEDEFSGINLKKCKYTFTESQETLGTEDETKYKFKIYNLTTNIEQALAPSQNWYVHVLAEDNAGNKIEVVSDNSVKVDETAEFSYTGDVQTAKMLPGKYKIECWGAQGGSANPIEGDTHDVDSVGGKGAYTSGNIVLNESRQLYVYIGGEGKNSYLNNEIVDGGYNGGGYATKNNQLYNQTGSGGGATDIRLVGGNWDNFNSLKSRIMVAAGGGGIYQCDNGGTDIVRREKGDAGGLIGYSSIRTYTAENGNITLMPTGGTQTTGGLGVDLWSYTEESQYTTTHSGKFGKGAYGTGRAAGGGGGYYGGASGDYKAAAGGSSFISGHTGCDAISNDSTENNIIHTGESRHYSEYVFNNTLMIDGAGYKWTNVKGEEQKMPKPEGGKYDYREGHIGDGYARITNLN